MSQLVKDLQSKEELDNLIHGGASVILYFWSASSCETYKKIDKVFFHLSIDFPDLNCLRVATEEQPEISELYSVSALPYFVFIKDGKIVDTLEGANQSGLANKVSKFAGFSHPAGANFVESF